MALIDDTRMQQALMRVKTELDDRDSTIEEIQGAVTEMEGDVSNLKSAIDNTENMDFVTLDTGTWEQGTINQDGSETTLNNRIRTADYISLENIRAIKFTVDDRKYVIDWFSEDNQVLMINDSTLWQTEEKVYTSWEGATKIRLLIAKLDNSSLMPVSSNIDRLNVQYKSVLVDSIENNAEEIQYAKNEIADINNMKGPSALKGVEWEIGTINAASGINENSQTRVRTVGYIDLSDISAFSVTIASGYKYVVDWYDSGKSRVNVTIYGAWQTENQSVSVPYGVAYMRLIIADINNGDASLAYVDNLTVRIDTPLKQTLDSLKNGESNYLGMSNAIAIKKNFTGTISAENNLSALPCIVHTTDVHGDSDRFKRACNTFDLIDGDMFVCSGDMVRYFSADDFSYVVNSVDKSKFVLCIGNHEAFQYATEQQVNEKFITPFASNIVLPTGVQYPTYFYKDDTTKKLRFISVNQYQSIDGSTTPHNTVHFHQEQITWFVNTLLSTPTDYGVIVVMHTPEQKPTLDPNYTKFKQKNVPFFDNVRYKPITEIIDAFISGETLNKTYTNGSGYVPATFSVSADFSTKNNGVEFIAYLTGHMHTDNISYVQNTSNKQLMLNAVCTNAWTNKNTDGSTGTNYPYYNELNDLGRLESGETQDAFNVYVIDRVGKNVRVARIGASLPYDTLENRDYMVIPYAD